MNTFRVIIAATAHLEQKTVNIKADHFELEQGAIVFIKETGSGHKKIACYPISTTRVVMVEE